MADPFNPQVSGGGWGAQQPGYNPGAPGAVPSAQAAWTQQNPLPWSGTAPPQNALPSWLQQSPTVASPTQDVNSMLRTLMARGSPGAAGQPTSGAPPQPTPSIAPGGDARMASLGNPFGQLPASIQAQLRPQFEQQMQSDFAKYAPQLGQAMGGAPGPGGTNPYASIFTPPPGMSTAPHWPVAASGAMLPPGGIPPGPPMMGGGVTGAYAPPGQVSM